MGKHAGRSGERWRRLKREVRARREPCCRCGQRIDYALLWPDQASFSVDHYPHALSTHPWLAEEPSNLHAAHLLCNQSAGNGGKALNIGTPSEAW
jgi:hypothetical protein